MSALTCFDDLVGKFVQTVVAPYGKVLVIPVKDFQQSWESKLRSEGHAIYSQTYDGGMACLVSFDVKESRKVIPRKDQGRLKEVNEGKLVSEQEFIEKHNLKSIRPDRSVGTHKADPGHVGRTRVCTVWPPNEEKRLLQKYKDAKGRTIAAKIRAILPEFKGLTEGAIYQRLWKLGINPSDIKSSDNEQVEQQKSKTWLSARVAVSEIGGKPLPYRILKTEEPEFDSEMIYALKKDLLDMAQELRESDCKTLIRALRYIAFLEK